MIPASKALTFELISRADCASPSVIMALGMKLNLIYTFVRAYEKKNVYNACGELFAEEKLVCPGVRQIPSLYLG